MSEKSKYEKDSYYDGHYVDSGLSQKDREKRLQESLENDKNLTEWPTPND